MKARELLLDCDFGDDVADNDLRLSQYFLETGSFDDVVNDRVDLILGEKGSGKSAIFRQIVHGEAVSPQLSNVIVLPAFNTQGSLIFRKLSDYPNLPEEAYRLVWFSYLIALVGNHLVEGADRRRDVRRLSKLLDKAGLRSKQSTPSGIWPKIDGLLERLAQRVDLDGELRVSPSHVPVELSLKGKLLSRKDRKDVDLDDVLQECFDTLASTGSRCWVLFDRLDEAFYSSPDLEELALRGLLRAHLDLTAYQGAIRTKLFLRTDVLDRITATSGFVNASHLRRHYLKWDKDGIVALIARRIVAGSEIVERLGLDVEKLSDRRGRLDICTSVLPKKLDQQDLPSWLQQCTTDGSGQLNPRNIITFLGYARKLQLEIYDRDDSYYLSSWPLVRHRVDAACASAVVGIALAGHGHR